MAAAEEVAGAPAVGEQVALRVCREGKVLTMQVPLSREDGLGTDCLVHWCGAQLQVRLRFQTNPLHHPPTPFYHACRLKR